MTAPARQPQLTELDVLEILRDCKDIQDARRMVKDRLATHTSPPAPAAEFTDAENKWCDDYAAAYNRGFDAGAKAEREQVLDELSECFLSDSIIYEGSFIHKTIEFLRVQQEQQP